MYILVEHPGQLRSYSERRISHITITVGSVESQESDSAVVQGSARLFHIRSSCMSSTMGYLLVFFPVKS